MRSEEARHRGVSADEGSCSSPPAPGLQNTRRQTSIPSTCSICLGELDCPVETNCGHVFCAQCILTHWNHDRHPQPCHCPICRRDVTLLLSSDNLSRDNNRLHAEISAYNRQMATAQGGLVSRVRDMPVLLQHMRNDVFRVRGGLPVRNKLYFFMLAIGLIFYVLNPIDLIPEGIFGIFGLVDDLFAIVYMLLYAAGVYRTYIANLER